MFDFTPFTHLTFDCYGTLIDWEGGILAALRPIVERHGRSRTDDQLLELFGVVEAEAEAGPYQSYRGILATVLDTIGERLDFTVTMEERAAFSGSVVDWPAFPDSAAALAALKEHFALVVISNIDDDLFAASASKLGEPFTAVITAQQVGSYKPNRQNFRFALETLGVPQGAILHVAQSLFHDIAPAKELGFATVWVNRRHDRPSAGATPPTTATPDLEIPDMQTLARLVSEARGA